MPAARSGLTVEIKKINTRVSVNDEGGIRLGNDIGQSSNQYSTEFSQFVAFVELWGERVRLHKKYLNFLSLDGLKNERIGTIQGWMNMPEAQMNEPLRRHAPLTSSSYQAEVTRRLKNEVSYSIRSYVNAYGIAKLEQMPSSNTLFGYFSMIAPGRVACSEVPIPILSGLLKSIDSDNEELIDVENIRDMAGMYSTLQDRFLRQVMAMSRLLNQGEHELALIGCVSTIEWFLNRRFPDVSQKLKSGKVLNASISRFIKQRSIDFLDKSLRDRLLELAMMRNEVVHGAPPNRTDFGVLNTNRGNKDQYLFVKEGIRLALEVYRVVNLNTQSPKHD